MRRFNLSIAAILLVFVLVVVEVVIVKSASKYEPQLGVLYAKVKIPEKTVVTAEMVEIKKVGISFVHRQSIRDVRNAAAKIARMDIEAGEMILSSKLGSSEMEEIVVKDKSKRLFSVEFKGDQANGWWLIADQNVDILFVPNEMPGEGQTVPAGNTSPGSVQILKDIRVAALIDDKGKLLKNTERAVLPKYISFEVTDEQASFLAYAKSNGRLEISSIPGK
jgi:pilus assembly protein CpaB